MVNRRFILARHLATSSLLLCTAQISARPSPQEDPQQDPPAEDSITPVVVTATVDGNVVTATYTPTSIDISGLAPPIAEATTITTTDDAGATVAVAVVAGAGIVGGAALAAWLFEPIPGIPPAPTDPPPYPTEEQEVDPPETEDPGDPAPSSTVDDSFACPFPTGGINIQFPQVPIQPQWTIEIPAQPTDKATADCKRDGNDSQLLHSVPPDFIMELSSVFCKEDQSKSQKKTLSRGDLPDSSSWKGIDETVEFTFEFKEFNEGCESHCGAAHKTIVNTCQYDAHVFYGQGSLQQGCGDYTIKIQGDPRTELICAGDQGNPFGNYLYRDAALDSIKNFCEAQDGKEIKKGDKSSDIEETAFSIFLGDDCEGSGTYTVSRDTCEKYLREALDGCDTNTVVYKHGGKVRDTDNCGVFEIHPNSYDLIACYPENKDSGYITAGEHVVVPKDMAQDAINAFCDRSGNGQHYVLDPAKKPDSGNGDFSQSGDFVEDSCTTEGMARCGYYYHDDGTRVEKEGDLGDLVIRIEAKHLNPNDSLKCEADQVYEIRGDRCKNMLSKLVGEGGVSACIGDDKNNLDLGTFIEAGDKGCVTWNMWAVRTS